MGRTAATSPDGLRLEAVDEYPHVPDELVNFNESVYASGWDAESKMGGWMRLGNRVNDLEARLATQGKLLAERDYENKQLRQANEAAERTAGELRNEIAALGGGGKSPAFEKLRTEKAAVEEQLRIARDERARLQRDINAIQQQAESSWATERMENALLRERINDIAAEVAKLAMQLEGPNSPIEAMLATEPAIPPIAARPANGAAASGAAASGGDPEGGGTLAERIRALQSHASRARQQQPG